MSRPLLSVVLPTIDGRQELLDQTAMALRVASPGVELVVVRNRRTIGEAWNAGGNAARGDYILFGADDVLVDRDGIDAALASVNRGEVPSPLIVRADGSAHHAGTMGGGMLLDAPTGTVCGSSPFPILRRSDWRHHVGPVPAIHYYADDYLSWAARQYAGLQPTVVREYRLVHLEGTVGRARQVARAQDDRATFLASIATRMSPQPAPEVTT